MWLPGGYLLGPGTAAGLSLDALSHRLGFLLTGLPGWDELATASRLVGGVLQYIPAQRVMVASLFQITLRERLSMLFHLNLPFYLISRKTGMRPFSFPCRLPIQTRSVSSDEGARCQYHV